MRIKKNKGRAYGIDLTLSEKRAMEAEIKRQLAEYNKKNSLEIEALILWELHENFNFGPKRLKKFHDHFAEDISALVERYNMSDSDDVWLCTRKLKDAGIDIQKWYDEEDLS